MGTIDRGREFLGVLEVTKGGKPVDGEPKSGKHEIRMRRKVTFHGDPDKALKLLETTFPGCTFEWAKEAAVPAAPAGADAGAEK